MKNHKSRATILLTVFTLLSLSFVLPFAHAVTADITTNHVGNGYLWTDFPGPIPWYPLGYPEGTWTFDVGTNHTFSAVPDAGYVFVNFTATDGNTTQVTTLNPINFAVVTSFTITAYFEPMGVPIVYIALNANLHGTAFLDYGGIGWAAPFIYPFAAGAQHSFTAQADPGYFFTNFTVTYGATTTTLYVSPIVWTVSNNISVTANFAAIPPPVTPIPTATPGGFSLLTFELGMTQVLEMVIGAIVVFVGILILMKASGAWLVGLILLVAGFFIQEVAEPTLTGIVAFSLETLAYSVFLYTGSVSRRK